MPPPIQHGNVPPLAECREMIQRAATIKLNASASFKLTAQAALQMAGFAPSVASTQTMIVRYHRVYKAKLKEQQQQQQQGGADPSASSSLLKPSSKTTEKLKPPPASAVGASGTVPTAPATTSAAAAAAAAAASRPAAAALRPSAATGVRSPRPPVNQKAPTRGPASPMRNGAAAAASTTTTRTKVVVPHKKRQRSIYRTSRQINVANARRQEQRRNDGHAMSVATQRLLEEKHKPKDDRKSSSKIVQEVNEEFGTNLSARTLRKYVQNGFVGQGLKRSGRPSSIFPDEVYLALLDAYKTHILRMGCPTATSSHLRQAVMDAVRVDERVATSLIDRRLRRDAAECLAAAAGKTPRRQGNNATVLAELDAANQVACDKLTEMGYNGDALRAKVLPTTRPKPPSNVV